MPFARDPVSVLRTKNQTDIASRLGGTNPFLRRSVLQVLAIVMADAQFVENGEIDWLSRQAVIATAENEFAEMWGAIRNVFRKSSTFAAGTVAVSLAVPASVIPAGTGMTRSGDGVAYIAPIGTVIAGDGTATLNVSAIVAGRAGNCDPGTPLTFSTPIAGVPPGGTVGTITGGAEMETDAALRTRYLAVWAAPPQGGDLADYAQWVAAVPGVTRAWAAGPTIMGAGSVTVYAMLDDVAHTNGLPIGTTGVSQYESRAPAASGDQLRIADAIYFKRPVTALVYAAAPAPDALNLTISEVSADSTIRAGIRAALTGVVLREASPGGVILPDRSNGGVLKISHIDNAISAVPGLDHFILVSPTADVVAAAGHIAVPGTVTFA